MSDPSSDFAALQPLTAPAVARPRTADPSQPDRWLRAVELLLAVLALAWIALPELLLARGQRRVERRGRGGVPFRQAERLLPPGLPGHVARWLGVPHGPAWRNVLRGEMAVVGPRPRRLDEPPSPAERWRPGLVNPWSIQQRTAVDHGSEDDADRAWAAGRSRLGDLGLMLQGALVRLLPARGAASSLRVTVGDVAFDNLDLPGALERLDAMMASGRTHQVAFVNPACVNTAAADRAYRRTLARCALVLPDGIGLKIGCAILGQPLRQNLNGTDLFPALCERLQRSGRSIYLLGGQPGVPEAVAEAIRQRWPGLRVAGVQHGFFGVAEEPAVVAAVRASGADCLLVARGVPVQEAFIDRQLPMLGVGVALGVGGLFDFVSGRIPRAPQWMRQTGLEWLWRLAQEPGRMWRRYLIGNATFLLRVTAQRLGLRPPRTEPPAEPVADAPLPAVRAVVLATQAADARLPLPPAWPAALLPVGHQTTVEHLMARLSEAGVRDVDLVADEHVDALRERLGDGERWGLTLRWRLPDPDGDVRGCIAAAARSTTDRLVIGPAHVLPAVALLERLVAADARCVDPAAGDEPAVHWTSTRAQTLLGGGEAWPSAPVLVAGADDALAIAIVDAAGLARAQQHWLQQPAAALAPASWIRHPWGAASPDARVHPDARLLGPVLVGPGCVVEAGAEVGPMTVLTRDVVVCGGTSVIRSIALPSTYIGPQLQLEGCVVHGNGLYHEALDATTQVSPADAMLLPLGPRPARAAAWVSRAAAALLWACALPALGAAALLSRVRGRALPWRSRPVLCPQPPGAGRKPQVLSLTVPHNPERSSDCALAALAGLREVALGRRAWFGARPRTIGQWHTLPRVWRQALAPLPLGLIHAPAWVAEARHRAEAQAVADLYGASTGLVRRVWRREFALR